MIKLIKQNYVKIIFLLFFLIVLLQHHFLWLYHDDYGYASLSYAVDIGNVGLSYNLMDILNFLNLHYFNWGGRIICFFIECVSLRLGLSFFRVLQSLVLTLIFYFIYKILSKNTKMSKPKLAALVISMYGYFEIMVFRDGFFWITASVNYVFPVLFFLLFVYFKEYLFKNWKNKYYLLFIPIVFITSFSHEQVSTMILVYLLLLLVEDIFINKKIKANNIVLFITGLIGFLLLALCPGSHNRLINTAGFSDLSIIGKLKITIPNLINGVFSSYNGAFLVLFFIMIIYITIYNLNYYKKANKLIAISSISNLILAFLSILKEGASFIYLEWISSNTIYTFLIYIMFIIQIFLLIYSISYYFYKKNILLMNLFISSIGCLCAMLISPYFPTRAIIGFEFVSFILIIYTFDQIFKFKNIKNISNYLIVPIFVYSMISYCTITYGYYRNDSINKYNDAELKKASEQIKNGEEIEIIKLKKVNDILYSSNQPYEEGFDYIYTWIKNYYSLPQGIDIVYE